MSLTGAEIESLLKTASLCGVTALKVEDLEVVFGHYSTLKTSFTQEPPKHVGPKVETAAKAPIEMPLAPKEPSETLLKVFEEAGEYAEWFSQPPPADSCALEPDED